MYFPFLSVLLSFSYIFFFYVYSKTYSTFLILVFYLLMKLKNKYSYLPMCLPFSGVFTLYLLVRVSISNGERYLNVAWLSHA